MRSCLYLDLRQEWHFHILRSRRAWQHQELYYTYTYSRELFTLIKTFFRSTSSVSLPTKNSSHQLDRKWKDIACYCRCISNHYLPIWFTNDVCLCVCIVYMYGEGAQLCVCTMEPNYTLIVSLNDTHCVCVYVCVCVCMVWTERTKLYLPCSTDTHCVCACACMCEHSLHFTNDTT